MLTSRICAPPSTCWRAISSASAYWPARTSFAKRGEPGDVRPLADVDEVRVGADHEAARGPRSGERRGTCGRTRGRDARARLPRSRGCAPASCRSSRRPRSRARPAPTRRGRAPSTRASRRSRRTRWAGRRSGRRSRSIGRELRQLLDVRRASRCGPSAQLTPTESSGACETEIQNASTVCPERLRPERSVIVTEAITGRRAPRSSNARSIADERRLGVQRVEGGLDEQQVDAAVDQAQRLLVVGRLELGEGHGPRAGIVDVARERGRLVRRARARRRPSAAARLARPSPRRRPRAPRARRRR